MDSTAAPKRTNVAGPCSLAASRQSGKRSEGCGEGEGKALDEGSDVNCGGEGISRGTSEPLKGSKREAKKLDALLALASQEW